MSSSLPSPSRAPPLPLLRPGSAPPRRVARSLPWLVFLLGSAWVQTWPWLAAWVPLVTAIGAGLVALVMLRRPRTRRVLWVVLACLLGVSLATGRAVVRLQDRLDPAHDDRVTRLTLQITGLPQVSAQGVRVVARVLASPVRGVPEQLMLFWPAPARQPLSWSTEVVAGTDAPDLTLAPAGPTAARPATAQAAPTVSALTAVQPGTVWQAAVLLRPPHGARNPGGGDYAGWLFAQGIRATATVRGEPWPVTTGVPWRAGIWLQQQRARWRDALAEAVAGRRYGGVVLALALGDQAAVTQEDWVVFRRTGIIHLVSISGMHVTLLAGLVALLVRRLWPWLRWRGVPLAERWPASWPAGGCALLGAWLYSLVAGWGVPAQRTVFMLAVVVLGRWCGRQASLIWLLLVAASLIVALDPWAVLSAGFWLSFGAVAVLMALGQGRWQRRSGRWHGVVLAVRIQLGISLALVPVLAWQFQSVSVVGPLANALAIPMIGLVATPLAVLALVAVAVPGGLVLGGWLARAAEAIVGGLMVPVAPLAEWAWADVPVAFMPWPWLVLGVLGTAYALLPRGPRWRWAGWLLVLPGLWQNPSRVGPGEWRVTFLDVGQGAAVVIETARGVVVHDAGPGTGGGRDAGARVVVPYLRGRGWRTIDELMISHADQDHAGGAASVLAGMPVARLRASFAAPATWPVRSWAPCRAGQGWLQDGVLLRVLHPVAATQERNAGSCVLLVQGTRHAALLTGDIGVAEEAALLARLPAGLQVDVVQVGHHGSRTSSAAAWVAGVAAPHAVVQAGFRSRFGHPHPEVVSRWGRAGTVLHRTDQVGAVVVSSQGEQLRVQSVHQQARRYWHETAIKAPGRGP